MAQELYAKIGEGIGDALFFFFLPFPLPPSSHNKGRWERVLAETYTPRFNISDLRQPHPTLSPNKIQNFQISPFPLVVSASKPWLSIISLFNLSS
jgi:hypothetical protein